MSLSRVLLSLLLSACVATAAETRSDPPLRLDRVEVTSERDKSSTVPSLATARSQLALTPGGAETIDANRYLRGRASTVEDTFALAPGVIAQSRFGSDEARLSIRGSGLQRTFHGRGIRILQDGVPVNLADGSFDMQAFEPLSAAYINVWRGGNALAYGASTLGGAIDYVSRTGRDAPKLQARAEAGSWEYSRTAIGGGAVRDHTDAYASFTHQSEEGFRDHAAQRNERLFANAGYQHSPRAETRLYLTAVQSSSELPGNLTRRQLESDPRQAAVGNVALNQKRDFNLLRIASKTSVQLGATQWNITGAWSSKDLDHPIAQVVDQRSNDFLLGLTMTRDCTLASVENCLRAGLLYQRGTIAAASFTNLAGRRGPLLAAATQTATNVEFFVENQIEIRDHLTLILGLSASANDRRNAQKIGPAPSYDLGYNRTMPKVGVRWDTSNGQVYANVSGSYEPPSFSEALTANAPRRAQTATTIELGTRGRHGPLGWDATIYSANLSNELLALDHDNNPATPATTINAEKTTHAGVELAAEIDLLGPSWDLRPVDHRLVFRAAWTYGRFRFKDDARYGNNTLAGLPPHLIRAELTWENAQGWYAGPTGEIVPQATLIDFRNTLSAEAHAVMGFRFGRRLPKGVSWFLDVRNVADRKYAATTGVIENANGADQPQFLPGSPRGFFAGVEYHW
jgi:iron complex outermembrane receptor protein